MMSGNLGSKVHAQQSSRGRKDYKDQIDPIYRRLDSLAKLLAAHSECVAVVIIDQKIHITANELFKSSKTNNQIFISVKDIYSYFNKLAKRKLNSENQERETLFCEKICTAARLKISYPEDLVKQIAKDVFRHKTVTIPEIHQRFGASAVIASSLYSLFYELYDDFLKLEEACQSSDLKFQNLQQSLLQNPIILHEEPQAGIHAEIQLLSAVVKQVEANKNFFQHNAEMYIGISKLCCLHCRCVLETAQQHLPQLNTNNLFRGNHDLDFEWSPAEVFKTGYNSTTRHSPRTTTSSKTVKEKLGFLIGQKSAQAIKSLMEQKKEFSSMIGSSSESEAERRKFDTQKRHLQQQLKTVAQIQKYGNFSDAIKFLNLAVLMYESDSFGRLFKNIDQIYTEQQKIRNLNSIIVDLTLKDGDIKLQTGEMERILQDPNLVGEKLAKSFSDMQARITSSLKSNENPALRPPQKPLGP